MRYTAILMIFVLIYDLVSLVYNSKDVKCDDQRKCEIKYIEHESLLQVETVHVNLATTETQVVIIEI